MTQNKQQANDADRPEINYPLVETGRPAIYRAMKYWGKKPHNIWGQYIERYCPPGGLVADPFAGSAVAAFEAVKAGRKAIAFDLNPLTAFFIEVTASVWKREAFLADALAIRDCTSQDPVYKSHYLRHEAAGTATVLNYRWEHEQVVGVAIEDANGVRTLRPATDFDREVAVSMSNLAIVAWHPTISFPEHPSVNERFIMSAGGDTIDHLWTRRNLFLLAVIFEQIRSVRQGAIRLQLLSAFIQTLHLCSKMVIPRNKEANRDFSGSWGRPDYMIRRRRMEQNPVDVFWRACTSHQGVLGMMDDAAQTFPNGISIHDAKAAKKVKLSADINYGAIDVADVTDYLAAGSVDFVITDPPYAGLIRYLPLSVVWLAWLEKVNKKYKPDLECEITVTRATGSRTEYRRRLRDAFKRIHVILGDAGRLVTTFHHQDVREFNDFVLAVKQAGFVIDKVTHQYNRRSGESNVANPYGVSASDFYVRCVKRRDIDFTGKPEQLGTFAVQKAIEIIGRRCEPTPYNFLFEALWPEVLQAGLSQPRDSTEDLRKLLNANAGPGRIFSRTDNPDARVGELWWFNVPEKYISFPDRPLRDRVADSVLAYLRQNVSVKLDDVIGALFKEYPNGLTPDPRTIRSVLERFATPSQNKWKISLEVIEESTRHSDNIATILKIGERLGLRRHVGRREQWEATGSGKRLGKLADVEDLSLLVEVGTSKIERLQMVDVVFLAPDRPEIVCLWEVENSTNFTSAIQRGSNADAAIPKFMVVPDIREPELLKIADPLFVQSFSANGWRYLTYTDMSRLGTFAAISVDELSTRSKGLEGKAQ